MRLAFAVCGAALIAFAGCGGGQEAPEASAKPEVTLLSVFPNGAWTQAGTRSQIDAVRTAVLARNGTAGAYRVRFVNEGDAVDCETLASTIAADKRILAVVGPLEIGCPELIGLLNPSSIALVSPTATDPCLTHFTATSPPFPSHACSPNELGLYPSGLRNFARVTATSDSEGRAALDLLAELGTRRPFVITEPRGFGEYLAGFQAEAQLRGVQVAGVSLPLKNFDDENFVWVSSERNDRRIFAREARRLLDSKADSLFLLVPGRVAAPGTSVEASMHAFAAPFIDHLRTAGFDGPIVTSLSLLGDQLLADAHGELQGVYLTFSRLPLSGLPAAAKRLAAEIHVDDRNADDAIYAAEAANVLMDAIANSDGTRAGVRAALFRVRRDGLLDRIAFGGNGDVVPQRIAVYRVADGQFVYDRTVSLGGVP